MSITITVEGDPQVASAEAGDTILGALLRSGVGFAYSCEAGNCGTCKCELVQGDILELEYSEHALPAAEHDRGVVLACRTQVWGDTTIRRLSAEEFIMHPSRVMACKVGALDFLTHDILRLRLAIVSGGPYTFSAGQFAKVVFAFSGGQARDYSMANRPDEETLEFHIRSVPGGISEKLPTHLKAGDAVKVSGPFGTSYLRTQHAGPMLLVAGGSGLAPIRSILRTALSEGRSQPIHLYFGVRAERDVYGEAELRTLQARYRNLSVHIVLSQERGSAPNRRYGLVTDAVLTDFPNLQGFMAYLAGPPVMVEAATELVTRLGMPARDVHADAFYATGESP
ncbi:MAG: 2Fe-2S iron-sulfur cluster-binding protein, partial [Burkholderiales bacterium]